MKNHNILDTVLPLSSDQISDLKKITNNFSNIQLAWLSGYFWKMANQPAIHSLNEAPNTERESIITIISASQTGNAKSLSKQLNEYFLKNEKKSNLINASDYKFKKISSENILIIIVSTQGEGEPPEEAFSLYKFIMSQKAPKLNNLKYSVFSLGDTSYDLFCQAGKDIDKRLSELGGVRLLDRVDADIEYQDDYKKWSKKLLDEISQINILSNNISNIELQENIPKPLCIYTKKNPALAKILINQKITGRNSIKTIHHIEIDISNLNMTYQPGDALGVWYKNDINLVKEILILLKIDISTNIVINNDSINILDALQNSFELTINTPNIVKKYFSLTHSLNFKQITENNNNLKKYAINTPIVNMIRDYPLNISAQDLVSFLRPLTPRLYSISSSQDEVYDEVHITVGVVKNIYSGRLYLGGSSGYLSQFLKEDDNVKIFVETNNNFRLPLDKNASIIMIGPGTGIAPFRAFLQQRDNDGSRGKNWLFFGNPSFTEDFLYQIEWQNYLKKGLLTKFNGAWSRDQINKVYIQDKIRENSKEIWHWIENGAYIYVCGNASKMAKDVEKVLIDIIHHNTGMNLEYADEFLNNLRLNRRYQRDIY